MTATMPSSAAPRRAAADPHPDADPRTLASMVAERMRRHPDRLAVLDDERALTYAELDRRCDTVAAGLQAAGVRRGDLVAVFLSRTVDIVAALLAVHRLGAAYVPLDPEYPAERLDFMVADSRPRALLADAATAPAAARFEPTPVVDVSTLPAGAPVDPQPPRAQDLAYVIYTSGSTGRPKGAMLEHRNTVNMLDWIHSEFSADDLAGVLLGTSICFDLSVFEVFGTLTGGGTVVVAANGLALPELRHRDRVTLLNTVPGVTAALVRAGELPSSVRIVIHSGDTTSRALADAVLAVPTVERLYNLYGPTEVVTWQLGCRVDRAGDAEPPIGTPFPGVGVHVLDPRGRPVPDGGIGELHLSGRQVCRGYLGRPELTAERFVERPELAPGRCYGTGDLVLRDAAGVLHYRGRTDFQVKIRGYRVELGEIEAALERDRRVEDGVVVAQATGADGLDRRIVAYAQVGGFAAATGRTPDADGLWHGPEFDTLAAELTGVVRRVLPEYMVPSAFGFLTALPTTPNGKPDRARLPRVRIDAAAVAGRAPEGPAELAVAAIWREVLGLDPGAPLAADVPFGALGGDSLLAAGVTARMRRRCGGAAVTLPRFHADPTIAALARLLPDAAGPDPAGGTAADADRLPHEDGPGPLPRTLRECWLGEQLAGEQSALWTVPVLVGVHGPVDVPVLQAALDALVTRHDALHTAILGPDTAEHVTPGPVPLEVVDVTHLDGPAQDAAALEAQDRVARTPLDLPAGRTLRAQLVRRAATRSELLLHLHHGGSDGLSYRPMVRDLAELYAALAAGTPLPAAPAVSVADANRYLVARELATAAERDARWRERLAGGPPASAAPIGHAAAAAGTWDGGRVELPVDPALAGRLDAFVRDRAAAGVSAFAVALAACAVRAHRETGATDLLVSAPVSLRDHPDLEQVVGLLHEVVPVRCDLSGDPTFGALVERLAAAATADRAAGGPDRDTARLLREAGAEQVRATMLVLAMQRGEPPLDDGARTWTYLRELDNGGAKVDCTLFWELDMPVAQLTAEYALQRYTAEDARAFLHQVVTVTEAGLARPDLPISRLPLLDAADTARITTLSGAADVDLAAPDVLAAVLATARRAPDAVAVQCPQVGPVSYRQLVAGAALVAAALPAGPAAATAPPVAVGAVRGAYGIAALLGVWLSGRGYLPLDVTHPPARLVALLADSEVDTVLADARCPELPATARVDLDAVLGGPPAGWCDRAPALPGTLPAAPARPAYRLYTSGSTGRPKGVTVPHRALGSFLRAIGRLLPLTAGDVVPFLTTPSFDISGLELWLPLTAGATVRVIDEDAVRDGAVLTRRLQGCTVVQLTPTGWQILLSGGWTGDRAVRALVGGEVVPPVLAEQLLALTGELWNVYGPTETTIWSSAHRVTAGDVAGRSVPVGRPLPNTVLHVVDAGGRPLPPGTVGEICIGGAAVADGYHRRDDLTADRFTALPELPRGAAPDRWYRTGDRGRWLPDGTLECLGRADGQVKVRGVRVEIGEVEAALSRIPGVVACAVTLDRAGTAVARLVGHLVLEPWTDAAAVEELLRTTLPAAYVPEVWATAEALPRTANGKIDRSALPSVGAATRAFEPPVTEVEQIVADIWCEVLELPEVGRLDSFLALGGHSLSATRVAALLQADLDLAVPVRLLFEHPRLCDLAAAVDHLLTVEVGA